MSRIISLSFLCLFSFLLPLLCLAQTPGGVTFKKKLLCVDPNEGIDVGDINNDGHLDIIAGRHWYAGPDFVPRHVRNLETRPNGYVHNNSEHLLDVDGDGLLDVIVGYARKPEIFWYKNPGGEDLMLGLEWERFPLAESNETNELYMLRDLDGCGTPEIIVSSWVKTDPLRVWKILKDDQGKPYGKEIIIGREGGGHGLAFGDINGDGREDIATEIGWYERPEGDPFAAPWKFHPETALPHPSVPFVLADLDGDGLTDIAYGLAHGYGIFWRKQLPPKEDGTTQWQEFKIDDEWQGAHVMLFEDIDNCGQGELIVGKRWRSHAGRDQGDSDPPVLYYYKWNASKKNFDRYTIAGPGENVGVGLLFRVVDINGDGWKDILTAGKTGTWLLLNEGFSRQESAGEKVIDQQIKTDDRTIP